MIELASRHTSTHTHPHTHTHTPTPSPAPTAYTVRAYAFAGSAPSAFAAKKCLKANTPSPSHVYTNTSHNYNPGPGQLLLINLSPASTSTVRLDMCERGYSAWLLSPPSNSSRGADPFSDRIYLNGHLLPNLVDGKENHDDDPDAVSPVHFLENIPVAAVTSNTCTIELPPLSVVFVCYE